MSTESIDVPYLVERTVEAVEKVYQRFIQDASIQHTRLAKIGFLGVMHELIADDPDQDPAVKAGVLKYIEDSLDGAADGLKSVIVEHMGAVGRGE